LLAEVKFVLIIVNSQCCFTGKKYSQCGLLVSDKPKYSMRGEKIKTPAPFPLEQHAAGVSQKNNVLFVFAVKAANGYRGFIPGVNPKNAHGIVRYIAG
jgi:hypothetical protein